MADAFRPRTTEERLSAPLNGSLFTTEREVPAEKSTPEIGSTMEKELGSLFADTIVVSAVVLPKEGKQIQRLTHARIPAIEIQNLTNFEFSTCDIGAQKFDAVVRTVVYLRSTHVNDEPALNSAMSVLPGTKFDGLGYVLAQRDDTSKGSPLEPAFIVERLSYVRKVTLVSNEFDQTTGGNLPITVTLFHRDEVITDTKTAAQLFSLSAHAYWGLQADGVVREGQQLTAEWYQVTTRSVVPAAFVTGGRTYNTTQHYSWPPVLNSIEIMDWVLREGSTRNYPRSLWKREGFSGPSHAVIQETWSKTPVEIDPPTVLEPLPINYSSPFYSISIGACLHGDVVLKADTGSSDPVYAANTLSARTFAATSPTDWPASLVASDEQTPFRGGFLRQKVTIFSPNPAP